MRKTWNSAAWHWSPSRVNSVGVPPDPLYKTVCHTQLLSTFSLLIVGRQPFSGEWLSGQREPQRWGPHPRNNPQSAEWRETKAAAICFKVGPTPQTPSASCSQSPAEAMEVRSTFLRWILPPHSLPPDSTPIITDPNPCFRLCFGNVIRFIPLMCPQTDEPSFFPFYPIETQIPDHWSPEAPFDL